MYFFEYYISLKEMNINVSYKNLILENISLLKNINKVFNTKYKLIDIDSLNKEKNEQILEKIRILSRKNQIGISTKNGSGPLPISRNKKLNKNGFLLIFFKNYFINIYPHISNKKRLEITNILKIFLIKGKIDNDNELKENDILKIIETFPELISNDLIYLGNEIEVNNGRIDCVFKKKSTNHHLLIEIEIYAKSISIEQCLKFKRAYSKKYNIPFKKIDMIIICGSIKESTLNAARTCNIFVYKLNLMKLN